MLNNVAWKYLIFYFTSRFPECSVHSSSKPLEIEQDPSFGFQSDRIEWHRGRHDGQPENRERWELLRGAEEQLSSDEEQRGQVQRPQDHREEREGEGLQPHHQHPHPAPHRGRLLQSHKSHRRRAPTSARWDFNNRGFLTLDTKCSRSKKTITWLDVKCLLRRLKHSV